MFVVSGPPIPKSEYLKLYNILTMAILDNYIQQYGFGLVVDT